MRPRAPDPWHPGAEHDGNSLASFVDGDMPPAPPAELVTEQDTARVRLVDVNGGDALVRVRRSRREER